MTRIKLGLGLAAGIGLFFVATLARAQALPPEANNPAVKAAAAACASDIQKLCPTVVPGGGRIVRCLIANEPQVTAVCRDSILKAKTALGR